MVNESLITRGRNNLMAKMMTNTAATHFMFIDADIRFEPDAMLKMMACDKDVIAGLYPKKALPVNYVINLKLENMDLKGFISMPKGGCLDIKYRDMNAKQVFDLLSDDDDDDEGDGDTSKYDLDAAFASLLTGVSTLSFPVIWARPTTTPTVRAGTSGAITGSRFHLRTTILFGAAGEGGFGDVDPVIGP